ncbi:MAG: hypothetical protein AAB354_08725 [candidate division KSB1 bacterium]
MRLSVTGLLGYQVLQDAEIQTPHFAITPLLHHSIFSLLQNAIAGMLCDEYTPSRKRMQLEKSQAVASAFNLKRPFMNRCIKLLQFYAPASVEDGVEASSSSWS